MPKIRKKRPCSICRRWFLPKPQVKNRQVTCGNPQCQQERHRRQCAKWNEKNADCSRSDYLQKKLERAKEKEPPMSATEMGGNDKNKSSPSSFPKLIIQPIEEAIEAELIIIVDYLIKVRLLRFQRTTMNNRIEKKGSSFH
ncbi:MAG: hypothetical protein GY866_39125 [Proteobacteria bacterium]|nr:hypothetical protein [Pseudomonadota bacterium]